MIAAATPAPISAHAQAGGPLDPEDSPLFAAAAAPAAAPAAAAPAWPEDVVVVVVVVVVGVADV
jgi:hypothetical protein